MRLFIGIPLAPAVVAELSSVVSRLRATGGNLRWTAPEQWHITLQFLGNAAEHQFHCLSAQLRQAASPPVPIALGVLGSFSRAGILFAGVAVSPQLAALQERVTASTATCGFKAEARAFHPHITLARARSGDRGQALAALQPGIASQPAFSRFTAREFLLYESELLASGARYTVRARFPLTPQS